MPGSSCQTLGAAILGALIAAACFGPPSSAQAQQAVVSNNAACPYWIDATNGKRPRVGPPGWDAFAGNKPYSFGGRTYYPQPDGSWIDATTGTHPAVGPPGWDAFAGNKPYSFGGHTYYVVPCPPPQTASTGGYIGLQLVKTWGDNEFIEAARASGLITNDFKDRKDPFGIGVILGYKFSPWANNVIASPFVSFDWLNAAVNHTFAGGSFLGSTDNFTATAGVKIGPQLDMGLWLYGIAGASLLNETLNVNFIPVASSTTATVPGATVGVGGAWQPSFLQGFGLPVSLFIEYQHTWWQDAHFDAPAASPAFNYTFRRQDDFFKFGFTVALYSTPAPAPSSMVFKALPTK